MSDADTYERSCAHWSEAGRAGMERFYALATEDYRQLAVSFDWAAWLGRQARSAAPRALRLLDVACGSGKFPSALLMHGGIASSDLEAIEYDLLDPTVFALQEARSVLRAPFRPARAFECRLQDLERPPEPYDVVWATHALYAIPPGELRAGLERFVGAIADGGTGFIAHAGAGAHYLRFYEAYLHGAGRSGTPYTSAEQIIDTLDDMGVTHRTQDIRYAARAPLDHGDVEGYLQRCLFDESLSLPAMLRDPDLSPYLQDCQDDDGWCFRQHVKMVFVAR